MWDCRERTSSTDSPPAAGGVATAATMLLPPAGTAAAAAMAATGGGAPSAIAPSSAASPVLTSWGPCCQCVGLLHRQRPLPAGVDVGSRSSGAHADCAHSAPRR
eukprot:TRINITY_DN5113_c0_g1_i8.p3 TRINITY_DN5113_c0_g1~~TRINITY_DN5113_c0_g1_i8.p3  ORF type:complete len:104 (-),score=3.93 TRINITY_DN5113_c0_g1_i8:76-387(-)